MLNKIHNNNFTFKTSRLGFTNKNSQFQFKQTSCKERTHKKQQQTCVKYFYHVFRNWKKMFDKSHENQSWLKSQPFIYLIL